MLILCNIIAFLLRVVATLVEGSAHERIRFHIWEEKKIARSGNGLGKLTVIPVVGVGVVGVVRVVGVVGVVVVVVIEVVAVVVVIIIKIVVVVVMYNSRLPKLLQDI